MLSQSEEIEEEARVGVLGLELKALLCVGGDGGGESGLG